MIPSRWSAPVLARCFQHETDHLLGTVFGDRLCNRRRRGLYDGHRQVPALDKHVNPKWPIDRPTFSTRQCPTEGRLACSARRSSCGRSVHKETVFGATTINGLPRRSSIDGEIDEPPPAVCGRGQVAVSSSLTDPLESATRPHQ